jgi:hypothetical protein
VDPYSLAQPDWNRSDPIRGQNLSAGRLCIDKARYVVRDVSGIKAIKKSMGRRHLVLPVCP